jgi:predicted lipoprotein with Yx(FWY)xxD motif
MRRRSLVLVVAVAASVSTLAACADDEPAPGSSSPSPSPEAISSPDATSSPIGGGGRDGYASPRGTPSGEGRRETEIEAEDSPLGTILTDGDGNTLYVFLNDTGGESTCYDQCETNWPPLLARGELKVDDDLDASLLGTTERGDGKRQVTFAEMPLYYFAGDGQPGQTNGQGVGSVWFVIGPDGQPIEA